jgi:NADPH:quinone reductase
MDIEHFISFSIRFLTPYFPKIKPEGFPMKALVVDAANGPLNLVEIPRPSPGPGQVLVEIHASGINPLDLKIRSGSASHAWHPFPAILGMDMAGVVREIGAGVDTFRPGDQVYGMTGGVGGVQGSLAQYTAVDARLLATKPHNLSMREAAALPLVTITAGEGMIDRVGVEAGQTVLVIGAAGGVGHIAVQLARLRGAHVFGVDRVEAADYLASIGATPIARGTPVETYVRELTQDEGFDIVFDCVGALDDAFKVVRRLGRVTSSLGWGTHSLAPLSFKCASYSGVFTLLPLLTGEARQGHGHILSEAAKMVEIGKLVPRLDDRRFAFHQAESAHDLVRSGAATGKVIVELTDICVSD